MKAIKFFSLLLVVALLIGACGGAAQPAAPAASGDQTGDQAASPAAGSDIAGEITVLTNRTDLVNTVFPEYAQRFNEQYPNVKVNFEAMTDYAGEVKIRLNTKDYGDVLLIPDDVPLDQLGNFFEPLGTVDELGQKYNFVTEKAYGGQVYGLPVTGNANGVLYNKQVFEQAGITQLPHTPEEFQEALRQIKANTDAIPLYTNYAAGWPLGWMGQLTTIECDPEAGNELARTDTPFAPGEPMYVMYKVLYDAVKEGLTEADPTTTDWEASKPMLGEGKIGTMVLGSWAIVQMQQAATDPSVIGFMPFPSLVTDKNCIAAGGDYKVAINVNSQNKAAARAWVDWFLNESNFAYDQGGIPPLKDAEFPPQLDVLNELDAELVAGNPAPAGEEGLTDRISSQSEVGLWAPNMPQSIVDAARGATDQTYDQIMEELNAKWAAARAALTQQ